MILPGGCVGMLAAAAMYRDAVIRGTALVARALTGDGEDVIDLKHWGCGVRGF